MGVLSLWLLLGCSCDVPIVGDAVDQLGLAPPEATLTSLALSTPPARTGNRVQLLTNGEAAFQERLALLWAAETSIYVQALIWKADSTGRALADALIRRKTEQPELDIRVIVDAYANVQDTEAQLMYFDLQNAGIEVEGFEAFYLQVLNEVNLKDWSAGNKRHHEKYWVVDGEVAVVGGMNLADEYARCTDDPLQLWRDQDVRLEGPVVDDVTRVFLDNFAAFKRVKAAKPGFVNPDIYWALWRKANPAVKLVRRSVRLGRDLRRWLRGGEGSEDAICDGKPVETAVHDDVLVQFVRSRPREGERHIQDLYLVRIARARESVLIENAYFVPTPDLVAALVAAAERGVTVQVITNSPETNDIPMITTVARLKYRELIAAGVEVYEWHGERFGEGTLHSKIAVFDDQAAIIGSYNLDPRSLSLNSEDVVLIEDARVATELALQVRTRDLRMTAAITADQATDWADPRSLPVPAGTVLPWQDPRFDRRAMEVVLLRQLEGSM
jgi:cardiolipin synthase C